MIWGCGGACVPASGSAGRRFAPGRSPLVAALATVVVLASASCSSSGAGKPTSSAPPPAPSNASCRLGPPVAEPKAGAQGHIRVLAAASLTEAFHDLGSAFTARNPGARIDFSFGASSTLVAQLDAGAPGDVLATADTVTMAQAVAARSVEPPELFTCNGLALIVPKGNPRGLRSLTSLEQPGVRYVVCAEPVPCGRFARQALAKAHVKARPAGSEQDVKAVVAKVEVGEADAGIGYVTDAAGAPTKVEAVPLPASQQVLATYPIAVARSSGAHELATGFVAFVRSAAGRAILQRHGFRTS